MSHIGGAATAAELIELEMFESALWVVQRHEDAPDGPTAEFDCTISTAVEGAAQDHLLCDNHDEAARRFAWLIDHCAPSMPKRAGQWRLLGDAARSQNRQAVEGLLPDRRKGRWAISVGTAWQVHTTGRFAIHHRNHYAARLVGKALIFHLGEICAFIGLDPADLDGLDPTPVYLYPTRGELQHAAAGVGKALGRAILRVTPPEAGPPQLVEQSLHLSQDAPLLLSSVLPHELAHLLIAHAVAYRPLPPYLDEGLALQFEPPAMQTRYDRLERGIKSLPALTRLLGPQRPAPQQELDYALARLCADLLLERLDLATVVQIVRRPGDVTAMLIAAGPWQNAAELEADWVGYVRRMTSNGR